MISFAAVSTANAESSATGLKNKKITNPPSQTSEIKKTISNASGQRVKSIKIEGLTRSSEEELRDLLYSDIGESFDLNRVRMGIRRAFRKDIFLDIQVFSEPYDGGVRLRYFIKEVPIVDKIKFYGNQGISRREIKDVFFFKKGDDFREQLLTHAQNSVLEFYAKKGFPDAKVLIKLKETGRPGFKDIEVYIEEGDPLIIRTIVVPDEVKMMLETVNVLDRDMLDRDLKKIEDYYKEEKYINPVVGPYSFSDGELRIPVQKGRRLELIFMNNRAIKSKELTKIVSFLQNRKITDKSIEEAIDRLKNLYSAYGYYHADVIAAVEEKDNVIVSFFIDEGDRVFLRNISFEGSSMPHDVLLKMISLKVDEGYNDNLLDKDMEEISNFYRSLGYLNISIHAIKEFYNDEHDLNLEFSINEGPQMIIQSVDVDGNQAISNEDIEMVTELLIATPYNIIDIQDTRYKLLSLYREKGFINATVEVQSRLENEMAYLTFKIAENRQHMIGKIVLKGNRKTKNKIIMRELNFSEGEVYNVQEILKAKQSLYKLGIFNEVSVTAIDTGARDNGKPIDDILLSVEESKAGSVSFSVGYGDYEQLRGGIDINYRNLGGYNRGIGFKAEKSAVDERYIFHFREPWLFNKPDMPLKVYLFREDKRVINIDTREIRYKVDKLGFIAGIEKELTKRLTFNFNYEYSFTETTDVDEGVILSKEDQGTLGISSISPSLYYDVRDNPFDPTSGSLHSIVVKLASKAILSEVDFIKIAIKSNWYFTVYKNIVFAFSLGGGTAFSFEGTKELPLVERYFLGGSTTVRGYDNDTLGPKGTDEEPTGGNIFAIFNSELRIPLGKGLGLVTFVDGGNVWTTISDINQNIRYTAGAGLRYKTPVGPIRIDYGHKLSREKDESAGEVHFSFGQAF